SAYVLCFFFFQAEDGIRDRNVTGVQTCALPILNELIQKHHITATVNRVYGALTLYFTNEVVTHYDQAENSDGEAFAKFFKLMLHQGINLAPSKFEAWFLTTEHTKKDIDQTLAAVDYAFSQMK